MDYIDKLAWIHIKNRKILTVRSQGKEVWYIPGGKREGDESDKEALIREVKEELAVDLVTETIKYFNTFTAQAYGKPEGVLLRMGCYTAGFKGKLKPSNEVEEVAWLNSDVDTTLLTPMDRIIFSHLKSKDLID